MDTNKAEYWQKRYDEGQTGWDLCAPHGELQRWLREGGFPVGSRVLVPGAGKGYDALLLAQAGMKVVAVDFSESACEIIRQKRDAAGLGSDALTVLQRDFFTLADEYEGAFDAIFEYTSFCAIPPSLRERYTAMLTTVAAPGARLLFFAFPVGGDFAGPPHSMTLDELQERFGESWDWQSARPSEDGPAPRRPLEHVVVMTRK